MMLQPAELRQFPQLQVGQRMRGSDDNFAKMGLRHRGNRRDMEGSWMDKEKKNNGRNNPIVFKFKVKCSIRQL